MAQPLMSAAGQDGTSPADVRRIAVLFQGADPGAWSGVPAGIERGLRTHGFEAQRVSADRPLAMKAVRLALSPLYGNRHAPAAGRELAALRTRIARRRLRSVRDAAAVVQMGTSFAVEASVPLATFEDMTVAQAVRMPSSGYDTLPRSAVEQWIARQRRAYAGARVCCVAAQWAADSVCADYGVPADKVHCVGFGRNLEPEPKPRAWDAPRFLWVGMDWERKGGPELLRAFAALRRELPAARLDLVGKHPRVSLAGVTGHGLLPVGEPRTRTRIAALFEQATAFVMPSRFEPFGIAYVEAGAAGVASVGTTVGGARDAIGPGGILVEPGDERALLAAMRRLADAETARALGRRACEHAAGYTWDAVTGRVLDALGIRA